MHAPSFSLRDETPEGCDLQGVQAIRFSPEWSEFDDVKPPTRTVGYVVHDPATTSHLRWWKVGESSGERLFRPAVAAAHEALNLIVPELDGSDRCVRCGVNEQCGDAEGVQMNASGESYPGELDDVCTHCLEAAHIDYIGNFY